MLKNSFSIKVLSVSLLASTLLSAPAVASEAFKNDIEITIQPVQQSLSEVETLKLCIGYASLKTDADRTHYKKELDLRSQLSVKDHQFVDKHHVENSMTVCGMYMALGKPISEQSRQIRPMTFKAVHVYPDKYYVSQSGMIVETLERKPDTLPPPLIHTPPKVQAPPVAPK